MSDARNGKRVSVDEYREWFERILDLRKIRFFPNRFDAEEYAVHTYEGTNTWADFENTKSGTTLYEVHDPYDTEEYDTLFANPPDAAALKRAAAGIISEIVHGERAQPFQDSLRAMWRVHAFAEEIAERQGIAKPSIITEKDAGGDMITLTVRIDDDVLESPNQA